MYLEKESGLDVFSRFDIDPVTKRQIFEDIFVQMVRLSSVTSGQKKIPIRTQLDVVAESLETNVQVAVKKYGINSWQYDTCKKDFLVAANFVFGNRNNQDQKRYNLLLRLDRECNEISDYLSCVDVKKELKKLPHVMFLFSEYQKYHDLSIYLDAIGLTYETKYNHRRRPSDYINTFFFSNRDKRDNAGAVAVLFWARKLLFSRWLNYKEDFWGNDTVNERISRIISQLFIVKVPSSDPIYKYYFPTKVFFKRVIEQEFLAWRKKFSKYTEAEVYFTPKNGKKIENFEDIDIPSTYIKLSELNLVPSVLEEIVKEITEGKPSKTIGAKYLNTNYYSQSSTRIWFTCGINFLEQCLTSRFNSVQYDHISDFFSSNPVKNLRRAKKIIGNIRKSETNASLQY